MYYYTGFGYYRIESHGKGILKPHQLLAEFDAIREDDKSKLNEHAFEDLLKSTQVICFCLYISPT